MADAVGAMLEVGHVVGTFQAARLFQIRSLEDRALHFMDTNASELLKHPSFLELSKVSL